MGPVSYCIGRGGVGWASSLSVSRRGRWRRRCACVCLRPCCATQSCTAAVHRHDVSLLSLVCELRVRVVWEAAWIRVLVSRSV
eukprot:2282692-Alexandrium_andersonii.AAC.1